MIHNTDQCHVYVWISIPFPTFSNLNNYRHFGWSAPRAPPDLHRNPGMERSCECSMAALAAKKTSPSMRVFLGGSFKPVAKNSR